MIDEMQDLRQLQIAHLWSEHPATYAHDVLHTELEIWEARILDDLRCYLDCVRNCAAVGNSYDRWIVIQDVYPAHLSAVMTKFFLDTIPGVRGMVIGPDDRYVHKRIWWPLLKMHAGSSTHERFCAINPDRELLHRDADRGTWSVSCLAATRPTEAFAGLLAEDAFVILHDAQNIPAPVKEAALSAVSGNRGICIEFRRREL